MNISINWEKVDGNCLRILTLRLRVLQDFIIIFYYNFLLYCIVYFEKTI